jgi:hypothetical protein
MKIIKLVLISMICISARAQKSPVDAIFEKYGNKEGFTTVIISKYMFSLFANMDVNQDDFMKTIAGLESIKILTVEDSVLNTKINFYKEIINEIPLEEYKELMVVKKKGQDLKMLIREKNGQINEFLLIGGGNDNVLISIVGKLNLESIARLSKEMNIQGMDQVGKLDSKNK